MQNQFDFSTQKRTVSELSPIYKGVIVAGFVGAGLATFGMSNILVSAVQVVGVIATGLVINAMYNRGSEAGKAGLMVLGGMVMSGVAAILPFTTLLQQATGSVTAAGVMGLVAWGIKKFSSK